MPNWSCQRSDQDSAGKIEYYVFRCHPFNKPCKVLYSNLCSTSGIKFLIILNVKDILHLNCQKTFSNSALDYFWGNLAKMRSTWVPKGRLRPSSYVAFLPCRILFDELLTRQKFDVWIGCRISAARSIGLVALSDRSATPTEMSNFSCVESSMRKCQSRQKKRKLGHSRPNATWT